MTPSIRWRSVAAAVGSAGAVVIASGCSGSPTPDRAAGSVASPTSGPAAAADYVNIGDSFSAGAGLGNLVPDSNTFCLRSASNFAHIVAARRTLTLDDVSCSGADTTDLTNSQYLGVPPQLDALSGVGRPRLVTVQLGGNDADLFSDAIRRCGDAAADDPYGAPCTERDSADLFASIDTTIFPSLRVALRRIKIGAQGARVLVVGYPYLVPRTTGCYPRVRVAAGDVPMVRKLENALNNSIRRAADESGVQFVDVAAASNGRDACAAPETRWVEPQEGSRTAATMHPNERGQQAVADLILAAL